MNESEKIIERNKRLTNLLVSLIKDNLAERQRAKEICKIASDQILLFSSKIHQCFGFELSEKSQAELKLFEAEHVLRLKSAEKKDEND